VLLEAVLEDGTDLLIDDIEIRKAEGAKRNEATSLLPQKHELPKQSTNQSSKAHRYIFERLTLMVFKEAK